MDMYINYLILYCINTLCSRRRESDRFQSIGEIAGDMRKQSPLPPIKGDGSVDYDGKYLLTIIFFLQYNNNNNKKKHGIYNSCEAL